MCNSKTICITTTSKIISFLSFPFSTTCTLFFHQTFKTYLETKPLNQLMQPKINFKLYITLSLYPLYTLHTHSLIPKSCRLTWKSYVTEMHIVTVQTFSVIEISYTRTLCSYLTFLWPFRLSFSFPSLFLYHATNN